MNEQLIQWWAGRSQRERALLLIMAALAIPVLSWLLILMPLDRALEGARTEHWAATQRLIQVRGDAESLGTSGAIARDSARAIAERSAIAAGFAPTRLDPMPDGTVAVTLGAAKPAALSRWLRGLDAEGLFVDTINIRPNADGTVAVDATLRQRRG